jgi:glyoxylase-like metal-dependent hydrolase (beta-lactamase superfamily II)
LGNPDLVQLSDSVYYLPGGVNTVIVASGGEAIIIDTGQDKGYGSALKKALGQLDVTLKAIINTHAHADHYGGNDYLLRQFDVPVYAPSFEASIIESPYLEPVYLFHGAKPPKELMSKWLLAKPSRVDVALTPGALKLLDVPVTVVDTSGHAHTHMSLIVGDVLIAADALFGASVLEKYPLPFGQDIAQQLKSAESLGHLDCQQVLPGHGEPTADVAGLIALNCQTFNQAAEMIAANCHNRTTEQTLQATCTALELEIADLPRYYLNLCVVAAYLSYLRELGRVDLKLQSNSAIWQQRT